MSAMVTHPTHQIPRWKIQLTPAHVLLPLLALLTLSPKVSGAMALFGGIVFALVLGNPYLGLTRKIAPRLLALSVMGLGGAMNLQLVARVGLSGFGYTIAGIAFTLLVGLWLGSKLRVQKDTALLVTVGTAICGGSAIAAMAPTIRAKESEMSVALVTVFILNACALVLFPAIGHTFHLDQNAFGLFSALAIHDTSSVVGASMAYGQDALQVATTVKLARALWIVPVTLLASVVWPRINKTTETEKQTTTKARRPWFILGFLAISALVTWVAPLRPVGALLAKTSHRTLVLTLFLTGCGLTTTTLKNVGIRPFVQGIVLWTITTTATLTAIILGLIAL